MIVQFEPLTEDELQEIINVLEYEWPEDDPILLKLRLMLLMTES